MKTKKHGKKREQQEIYKDPVCGMEVSRLTAPVTCDYHDRTWYFCSDLCREKFEDNPEEYVVKWPRKGQ